jgi:hypothetical protein
MNEDRCPFCHLEPSRLRQENAFAAAFADAFPVAEAARQYLLLLCRHIFN